MHQKRLRNVFYQYQFNLIQFRITEKGHFLWRERERARERERERKREREREENFLCEVNSPGNETIRRGMQSILCHINKCTKGILCLQPAGH